MAPAKKIEKSGVGEDFAEIRGYIADIRGSIAGIHEKMDLLDLIVQKLFGEDPGKEVEDVKKQEEPSLMGFPKNTDPIVGQIQPITMMERKTHRSTLNYPMAAYEKYDPQTQRTENPFSLLEGKNAGSKDRTVEPYFERGKNMVEDFSGFDNKTRKNKHQQGKENGSETEIDNCAYQVLDQMLLRRKLVTKKKKRGSTHNGSCDSTGFATPCTKLHVKKRFHKARIKREKKCYYGSSVQVRSADKLANQVWEPGGSLSPKSQLSWLERLGDVRILKQSDAYIETCVGVELLDEMQRRVMIPDLLLYGTLIWGLCSVEKVETNKFVKSERQESGIKVAMWIYAMLIDVYFKSGNSTKGLHLLEEMLRLDSEVTIVTLFPEDSKRQLRSSFKHICRRVVTDEGQKKLRGDDIRNEQDNFSGNCGVLVFSVIVSAELQSRQGVVGMCKHQRGTMEMRQTLENCHGDALLELLTKTELGRDTLQRATDVLFIRVYFGNQVSSFFIYGRFGSPRPPERSFSHLILFETALLTSNLIIDDSNTFRSKIRRLFKAGLEIDDKQMESRRIHVLPPVKWPLELCVFAVLGAAQLKKTCTELDKDQEQHGFINALRKVVQELYAGELGRHGRVSKTKDGGEEKLYWEGRATVVSHDRAVCWVFQGNEDSTRASDTLLQLLPSPTELERLVIIVSTLNLLVGKEVLQAEIEASLNTRVNIKLKQEEMMVKENGLLDLNCTREWLGSRDQPFSQHDLGDKVSFKGRSIDTIIAQGPCVNSPRRWEGEETSRRVTWIYATTHMGCRELFATGGSLY